MALEEINGELIMVEPPSDEEVEEMFALAMAGESHPDNVVDHGPGGHNYYDDVVDAETISWCFAYARKHPEDEYIQERVRSFQELNQSHRERHGTNMPGYDATYFPEDGECGEYHKDAD